MLGREGLGSASTNRLRSSPIDVPSAAFDWPSYAISRRRCGVALELKQGHLETADSPLVEPSGEQLRTLRSVPGCRYEIAGVWGIRMVTPRNAEVIKSFFGSWMQITLPLAIGSPMAPLGLVRINGCL